jgi:hypothetical protein
MSYQSYLKTYRRKKYRASRERRHLQRAKEKGLLKLRRS